MTELNYNHFMDELSDVCFLIKYLITVLFVLFVFKEVNCNLRWWDYIRNPFVTFFGLPVPFQYRINGPHSTENSTQLWKIKSSNKTYVRFFRLLCTYVLLLILLIVGIMLVTVPSEKK